MGSSTADARDAGRAESTATVLIAGAANLGIAIAKAVVGVLSGSSAMLAEAAHSVADTMNQAFLLTALRRSSKPADARHPFGYGMERYFWSLLAAVGIFVLGAGFSIYQGVEAMLHSSEVTNLVPTYVVLGLSFVCEGTSWLRAISQVRSERAGRPAGEPIWRTDDPTVKTVLFEDSAALIGILIATVGITLHVVTEQAFWDGLASVMVGLLLVGVAYSLGRENKAMLVGQAVAGEQRNAIRTAIESCDGIDTVVELLTMRLSPDDILVAARVDVADDMPGGRLEHVADEVEQRLREEFAQVRHVFLDPTDADRSPRTSSLDPH